MTKLIDGKTEDEWVELAMKHLTCALECMDKVGLHSNGESDIVEGIDQIKTDFKDKKKRDLKKYLEAATNTECADTPKPASPPGYNDWPNGMRYYPY